MSRLKFYLDKANMLAHFIWWREWKLVRDEWNMTYEELMEAHARFPEIERRALERLLKAIEEQESNARQSQDPEIQGPG